MRLYVILSQESAIVLVHKRAVTLQIPGDHFRRRWGCSGSNKSRKKLCRECEKTKVETTLADFPRRSLLAAPATPKPRKCPLYHRYQRYRRWFQRNQLSRKMDDDLQWRRLISCACFEPPCWREQSGRCISESDCGGGLLFIYAAVRPELPCAPNRSVLASPLQLYLAGTQSVRFPLGYSKQRHRVSKSCCLIGAVRKPFFELSCLQDRRVFFRHVANANDDASEWGFRLSFSSLFCEVKTGAIEWTDMLRS